MSAKPPVSVKHNICVICEGFEELYYFQKLIDLGIWDQSYSFRLINVKGASRIFPRFQNEMQNDWYEAVLIFCDTDREPYSEYKRIKDRINQYFQKRKAAQKLIIYANPCTMQIMLMHFGEVRLTTQAKKSNAPVIERLTGVEDYNGHEGQIKEICSKITRSNYQDMRERVSNINFQDDIVPSTNFIDFLEHFEGSDPRWISDIREACARAI